VAAAQTAVVMMTTAFGLVALALLLEAKVDQSG
jgi:hypothetical protein